ncbi:MAG: type II toxin-antitoxin system RelE family toxin [Candidatus Bathyarchaeia archaeon]
MPYEIRLHRDVAKALERMEPKLKTRIIQGLRVLQENPYEPRPSSDIVRLRGTKGRQDLFRLRIGDYRAVYAVERNVVYVTDLFHRGRGYE